MTVAGGGAAAYLKNEHGVIIKLPSPWLVRTLDRLEAIGLARRHPRRADRRARSLAITEDVRAVAAPCNRKSVGALGVVKLRIIDVVGTFGGQSCSMPQRPNLP